MSQIDLKELPEAHLSTGDQDRFELFARDFLEAIGFRIIEGPGRGADRGRDLLVGEPVGGAVTASEKLWVVSAKHKAHSGRSVSDADETDPIGRVRRFKANGFMPFYSTLPSGGLDDTFARIKSEVDVYVWDSGRIAQRLAGDERLSTVFQTYLSESWKKLGAQSPTKIFSQVVSLDCGNCGKDLHNSDGIVGFVKRKDDRSLWMVEDLYWACRGACDKALSDRIPVNQVTAWQDLSDLRIPVMYLKYIMVTINNLRDDRNRYSDRAFEKEKHLILALAQDVVREATETQKERIRDLGYLPGWLGGLADER